MKIKTSELIGPALDWAVAKCEGAVWNGAWYDAPQDGSHQFKIARYPKETVVVIYGSPGAYHAWIPFTGVEGSGPTPLVAAMRCYVASKLGDEVELPEELS